MLKGKPCRGADRWWVISPGAVVRKKVLVILWESKMLIALFWTEEDERNVLGQENKTRGTEWESEWDSGIETGRQSKERWQWLNTRDIVVVAPSNHSPPGSSSCVYLCVCVCVCEREREREIVLLRNWETGKVKKQDRYSLKDEKEGDREAAGVKPHNHNFWSNTERHHGDFKVNPHVCIKSPAQNGTFCQL